MINARLAPDFSHLVSAFGAAALAERPGLFSRQVVRAKTADLAAMANFVAAMQRASAHPAYRAAVGADAQDVPASAAATAGVCMGYDFHLTVDGPKLIEINTNAGGLALVAELMTAWGLDGAGCLAASFAMFDGEWASASPALVEPRALAAVAIVDQAPAAQYLAPEFERFRALFEANGIAAQIADPAELEWDAARGRLACRGQRVDLVYNRLTDFALAEPQHAALLSAWLAGAVVLTPHPLAHRLMADKSNLVKLANPAFRALLELSADDEAAMATCLLPISDVPREDAEALWVGRKNLFFKPAAGFGSRAAYRGDKLTKRVFEEILGGGYVAQAYAPPAEIAAGDGPDAPLLKYDVRNYAWQGRVLAVAARLYQGQTTNFRTPGGGFAPVIADVAEAASTGVPRGSCPGVPAAL